ANAVDDFGNRLRTDRLAATEAMRLADPGVEEAQEVVNLRDGADGRAGIWPEPFLLDRNRRREPLCRVDLWFLHLRDELARIRRQRLHVAPLTIHIERVEGERRLSRSRETRDHDQSITRQLEGEVLQVVLSRALDPDRSGHQDSPRCDAIWAARRI